MSLASPLAPTTLRPGLRAPFRLVQAVSGLLILVLLAAAMIVLLRLREDALLVTEQNMSTVALTLAEQADRAVQGIDLVLDGVARLGADQGVVDGESFGRLMSSRDVHNMLVGRMIGLPQLNALILYGLDGHVVNSSRSWPLPAVNVSDMDYFQTMTAAAAPDVLITAPFRFKTDGMWTLFLIRKAHGANGKLAGLLVAAIELRYFEEFYRSVSVGDAGTISLLRGDGVQLARFPPAPTTGQNFMAAQRFLGDASAGTFRGDRKSTRLNSSH